MTGVGREAELLNKFLLPNKSRRRFRNLIGDRLLGSLFGITCCFSNGGLAFRPLPFLNKQPDRPHQILGGDIDIRFPENLGDPVDADPAPMGFQDLVLALDRGQRMTNSK